MRWIRRIALTLGALIVLALAALYGGSEWIIRQSRAASLRPFTAATDPARIAEGGRLAHLVGCRGCHREAGQGQSFVDSPMIGTIGSPALAPAIAHYSDAELDRLIRNGVKRDGTTLFIMPSHALVHLADDDVAAIIGWMRTLQPARGDHTATNIWGPLARAAMLTGKLPPSFVATGSAPAHRPADLGRYISSISCLGCHALHQSRPQGGSNEVAPALAEAGGAYDEAALRRLLRTGIGMSGHDLGEMSGVARGDLHVLTDAEIGAIHAYLAREASKAPPS